MPENRPYEAYLIRLWPTRRGGVQRFRISVQNVATGERQEFRDLQSLLTFFLAQSHETPKEGG